VGRLVREVALLAATMLVLSGCTSGDRASDPAASAVRDAHSSVASLVVSLHLLLDERTTQQVTQVALDQCLEDLATAQSDVVTATDADRDRREVARKAIAAAVDVLVGFGSRGAGELNASDLSALEQVDRGLVAAEQELGA
jgi:hypothetical protein